MQTHKCAVIQVLITYFWVSAKEYLSLWLILGPRIKLNKIDKIDKIVLILIWTVFKLFFSLVCYDSIKYPFEKLALSF